MKKVLDFCRFYPHTGHMNDFDIDLDLNEIEDELTMDTDEWIEAMLA